MRPLYIWHVWPGQGWPVTAAQELAFVESLRTAAVGRKAEPSRPDVTCLLNALRCGITLDTLLTVLPGVDPAGLLACYDLLESARASADRAWRDIIDNCGAQSLAVHAGQAQKLLPVPVGRIAAGTATTRTRAALDRLVLTVAAQVSHVGARATAIERQLSQLPGADPRGLRLGAQLHNPLEPSLWSDPYYLPARVGTLSPTRVAELLGERRV